MNAPARREAPDQRERDAAIAERARNVVIDAGAGTGKTTILVERVVRMVAPPDGSDAAAVPISRIAAVTFTRRAAGEMRLRIRERLLGELASPGVTAPGRALLRDALAGLDTAHVGTIHSFADRLLRLRPVEARLSPSYEIAEDNDALVRETFEILLHAAQTGALAGEVRGTDAEPLAEEAQRTVVDALRAGLRRDSEELEHYTRFGLDALVRELIDHRDVPPVAPEVRAFDRDAFVAAVRELAALVATVGGDSSGARWLRRTSRLLAGLAAEEDPVAILAATHKRLRGPHDCKKGTGFGGDETAWRAWKLFDEDRYKRETRERPLRDDILEPLRAWLAPRLVRLFPVVIALYGKVKERHRAVDQIDLLLELRALLRDDRASRAFYQSLFDHVLVDEFQDTDPLQAEIVVFLCEDGAEAASWRDARLAPGKLTIVGDPKQSIYRFRRADIGMYDAVRRLVTAQEHLTARLSANFRSVEPLIRFFNDRFAGLLGTPRDDGVPFDAATGEVFHQDLEVGRADGASAPAVEILPHAHPEGRDEKIDAQRDLEGEVVAVHLRQLVEHGGRTIPDPVTREQRPLRWGDVAVLTLSTFTLPRLFKSLDRFAVPHAARGGRLFLEDDLQRRFILGLRAVANRDDGPALAALLRPPFFAVDPLDLLRERAHRAAGASEPPHDDEAARRAHEAREIVRELRARRFERPPGETARALL
ncbi:MAG: UvrD-helicase domain-containing protein, partial [Thermodesulfobacteriota bacterium]